MAGFLKKLFGTDTAGTNGGAGLSEPDLTIERARNEMQLRTEAAIGLWGMDSADWAVDLEAGIITFTNAEKGWVITAPVQVVGTFDTQDDSWLWGWDHPSVPEPVGGHARLVRDFGATYDLTALTTRKIAATMQECWEFTALACHLGGAQGGYSGPAGTARVFMTFGTVTIDKGE